jgi:hypothetical protein
MNQGVDSFGKAKPQERQRVPAASFSAILVVSGAYLGKSNTKLR